MKPEVAHSLWVGLVYFVDGLLRSFVTCSIIALVWLTLFILFSYVYVGGASFKTYRKAGWGFNTSIGPIWTLYFLVKNAFYSQPAAILFGIVVTTTAMIFVYQLVSHLRTLEASKYANGNSHLGA